MVVEGSDDKKLFAMLVRQDRCSIVPAYGKENVIRVVSMLEDDGFQGILGLVDKGFDEIEDVR